MWRDRRLDGKYQSFFSSLPWMQCELWDNQLKISFQKYRHQIGRQLREHCSMLFFFPTSAKSFLRELRLACPETPLPPPASGRRTGFSRELVPALSKLGVREPGQGGRGGQHGGSWICPWQPPVGQRGQPRARARAGARSATSWFTQRPA